MPGDFLNGLRLSLENKFEGGPLEDSTGVAETLLQLRAALIPEIKLWMQYEKSDAILGKMKN